MIRQLKRGRCLLVLLLMSSSLSSAQETRPAELLPMAVVVSELRAGALSTEIEFIGTVYYSEVSDVAAESSGRIETVCFEEGQRVRKGEMLLKINAELTEKILQGAMAGYEEGVTHLEKARADLSRTESLYRKQLVPEQRYTEAQFKVQGLEKKVASQLAEVERLKVELEKKSLRAPFDGLVVRRFHHPGEWLRPGVVVATLARDDLVDVAAEVPEGTLRSIRPGMDVRVRIDGRETSGKLSPLLPRGDPFQRSYPIRIRLDQPLPLAESAEATVILPGPGSRKCFFVPREALTSFFELAGVFTVIDSRAKLAPVEVLGHQDQMACIVGADLSEGMKVVIKGNERLRDGQPVILVPKGR